MDDSEQDFKFVLLGRAAPFPEVLQGRWGVDVQPELAMDIEGSELTWGGERIVYEDKSLEVTDDGYTVVTLYYDDDVVHPDDVLFRQLILFPDGDIRTWSMAFAERLVRAAS